MNALCPTLDFIFNQGEIYFRRNEDLNVLNKMHIFKRSEEKNN